MGSIPGGGKVGGRVARAEGKGCCHFGARRRR